MMNGNEAGIVGDLIARTPGVLLDAGIRGAVLLAVVLGVAAALSRATAATRHAVLGAGLLAILMLPIGRLLPWRLPVLPIDPMRSTMGIGTLATPPGTPTFSTASETAELRQGVPPAIGMPTNGPADEVPAARSAETAGSRSGSVASVTAPVNPLPDATVEATEIAPSIDRSVLPAEESTASSPRFPASTAVTLIGLWLLGIAVLSLRMGIGHWRLVRQLREAEPVTDPAWTGPLWESADRMEIDTDVRLFRHQSVEIPFATGILRPTIVVPGNATEWTEDRRRAVLMHELAHIARKDILLHHLSRWTCVLHWMNPLAWFAARRLRAESEMAADDLVIGAGTLPSAYADHLLQVLTSARGRETPGPVLPLARRREFEGRILAILEPRDGRMPRNRTQAYALAATILVLAFPLAALAPADHSPEGDVGVANTGNPSSRESEPAVDQNGKLTLKDRVERLLAGAGSEPVEPAMVAVNANPAPNPRPAPTPSPAPNSVAAPAAAADAASPSARTDLSSTNDRNSEIRDRSGDWVSSVAASVTGALAHAGSALGVTIGETVADALGAVFDASDYGEQNADTIIVSRRRVADLEHVSVDVARVTRDAERALRDVQIETIVDVELTRQIAGITASMSAAEFNRLSRDQRIEVIERLEEVNGDPRAVAALVRALQTDPVPEVRIAAARGLGELHATDAVEALGAALLRDEHPGVRAAAARALEEIGDERAVSDLVAALQDADGSVRRAALNALDDLETVAATQGFLVLLTDPDPQIRQQAAVALSRLDLDEPPAQLLEALSDTSPANVEVRLAVVRMLRRMDSPRPPAELLGAIADPDPRIRRAAIDGVRQFDLDAAPEEVIAALQDPNAEVRLAAVRALGDIEDPASMPALEAALQATLNESATEIRRAVIDAFDDFEISVAPAVLVSALGDVNAEIRRAVARALGEIQDPATIAALEAALDDPDPEVRQEALKALLEFDSPVAIESLIRALNDEDPAVRRRAAGALGDYR